MELPGRFLIGPLYAAKVALAEFGDIAYDQPRWGIARAIQYEFNCSVYLYSIMGRPPRGGHKFDPYNVASVRFNNPKKLHDFKYKFRQDRSIINMHWSNVAGANIWLQENLPDRGWNVYATSEDMVEVEIFDREKAVMFSLMHGEISNPKEFA